MKKELDKSAAAQRIIWIRNAAVPSEKISAATLKQWRQTIAVIQTLCWVWTTLDYGLDYVFYYSNWGNTFTMLCFWLLLYSHKNLENSDYHDVVITFFELTLTMEYCINPLYWSLLYDSTLLLPGVWSTYRGPFCNHLMPFVLLNIEWLVNGFHFHYYQTRRYLIILTFTYFSANLMGSIVMGEPIYYFVNYSNPKTFIIIIGIIVYQSYMYLALSYVNNSILKKIIYQVQEAIEDQKKN